MASSFLRGGATALASDPPQVLSVYAPTAQAGYIVSATYRMANNGTGSNTGRLCLALSYGDPEGVAYAGYFDTGGYHLLPRYTATTVAEATSGTYNDWFAGRMDGDGASTYVTPQWWNNGGSTKDQVRWGTFTRSGFFWDMIYDGSNNWYVGYYLDGSGVSQPGRWRDGFTADTPVFFPLGGLAGGEAKCISKDLYAGGRLIDGSDNIPVVWTHSGGIWTVEYVTASSDWPSGRTGYVVGITDIVSGDDVGPYAVGWMEATDTLPGQPFIYSVTSNEIRLISSDYGVPLQVSNKSHTSGEPEVSFVGNSTTTGKPYIWIGSPDKDSVWTGVANDPWSFLDADVSEYRASAPTTATGLNSAFNFGGTEFPTSDTTSGPTWVTTASDWTLATSPDATILTGSDASGSTLDDVLTVNGKFARVNNGISAGGTDPEIKVKIDAVVSTGATEIGFRTTAKTGTSPATEYKIDVWDWTNSTWDNVYTANGASWWRTKTVKITSSLGDYIQTTTGNVRARMTVRKTGPFFGATWTVDIEQLVWMWN